MIANATAHRRANAFAQALDAQAQVGAIDPEAAASEAADPGAIDGGTSGRPDGRSPGRAGQPKGAHAADRHADPAQARMLTLADGLATLPSPGLDPEVKTVQRAQLVAAMEAAFAGGSLDPSKVRVPEQRERREPGAHRGPAARFGRFKPRSRWGRRLAVSGLALGVTAGGFSGAAVASSDALPGDTLYGLKRSMEDLRLTMAGDNADKGEVYLEMASTRLKEARRLMERSKAGPLDEDQLKDVRRALSGVHDEAAEGHRLLSDAYRRSGSLGPIQTLASFSDEQREQWSQLSDRIPDQLATERDQVSSVFDAIDHDVTPLRPLLPEPGSESDGADHRRGGRTGADSGTGHAGPGGSAPSAPTTSDGKADGKQSGSARPQAPDEKDDGLLDGGGLLEPPEPDGSGSPSGDGQDDKPGKSVTLPPLLPGLLPGLGLETGDDG